MSGRLGLTRKRLGALLFLGLSLFYGAQISAIPTLPVDALEAMNARSLPWALTLAGIALSIALFVTGGANQSGVAAVDLSSLRIRDVVKALLLLIWTAVYASLLDWLGFLLATIVFLFGGFWLLGERRGRVLVGTTLVAAGVLYVVLRFGLGVYLPGGAYV